MDREDLFKLAQCTSGACHAEWLPHTVPPAALTLVREPPCEEAHESQRRWGLEPRA
jgi:hypothetical protein